MLSAPEPIYASRSESTFYNPWNACDGEVVLGPEDRRSLLAYMLGIQADAMPWKSSFSSTIVYRSQTQFDLDLAALIAEHERQYLATALALAAKGVITKGQIQHARPWLDLRWIDSRGQTGTPIVQPSFLPKHVTWKEWP